MRSRRSAERATVLIWVLGTVVACDGGSRRQAPRPVAAVAASSAVARALPSAAEAPAPRPENIDAGRDASVPAQAWVVVPATTPLFVRAHTQAPFAIAGRPEATPTFVVLADRGPAGSGFRAVDVPAGQRGCYSTWNLPLTGPFYVSESALATVLTRPLSAQFDDGTAFWLDSGVVVASQGSSFVRVPLDGLVLQVSAQHIPGDALANVFLESKRASSPALPPDDRLRGAFPNHRAILPGGVAKVGGAPLQVVEGAWFVTTDDHGRVASNTFCAELVARATSRSVVTISASEYARRWAPTIATSTAQLQACSIETLNLGQSRSTTKIRVAKAHLPGGEIVGDVEGCLKLGEERKPAGARRCFSVYLDGRRRGARPFRLCFDADVIVPNGL